MALAAVVATACTGTPKSKASPSPRGMARFYAQRVSWRDCGGGFQCGTVNVPLDYAHPDNGRHLTLAVNRLPAEGPRKGSLVVNPGGPGGSGVQFVHEQARQFGAALRRNFDLVGFDPRGVGASRIPVRCLTGKQLDTFFGTNVSPDDPAQIND